MSSHCPACRSPDTLTASVADAHAYGGERTFVACCKACGRCDHHDQTPYQTCGHCGRAATHRSAWAHADHLPRPRAMDSDEFAVRATLYLLWATRPASEFVGRLHEFADWFAERDMPEEAACRAAWELYGKQKRTNDPRGWYQWAVPLAPGWVTLDRAEVWSTMPPHDRHADIIDETRAKGLIGTHHNGGWFLGWPPGFVRFTGPLYYDHTKCRVTVERNRSLGPGTTPVERQRPAGYATLFYPPTEMPARQSRVAGVKVEAKTPSLFDDTEAVA